MTLYQLSERYSAEAETFRRRIGELKTRLAETEDEGERLALQGRIRLLSSMWRDLKETAALTGHYYERGFFRNAKYIL